MTIAESFDQSQADEALLGDPELAALVASDGAAVAGLLLDRRAQDGFTPSDYWDKLCREFRRMICDKNAAEYAGVREQADKCFQAGKLIGLPVLCFELAKTVGLTPALITPFVAVLIQAVVRVNVESWCKVSDPDDPAGSLFDADE